MKPIGHIVQLARRRLARRRYRGPRGIILMYHRVAEPDTDPWSLAVRPDHFAEHLEVIRRWGHPARFGSLVRSVSRGSFADRSVVVTFDDGYVDNLTDAEPLLRQYEVPGTVFVATGYIGQWRAYWWDELASVLLAPGVLPARLRLERAGQTFYRDLGEARKYDHSDKLYDRNRNPWESPAGSRLAFYYDVWQVLRILSPSERAAALETIFAWAGTEPESTPAGRPLSRTELGTLNRSEWVDMGAHTVTHPLLTALDTDGQETEIGTSRTHLESLLGHDVEGFSYPFGEYHPDTVDAVRRAGFAGACIIGSEPVRAGMDPCLLPRFEVRDWSGAEFERRLSRWYHLY